MLANPPSTHPGPTGTNAPSWFRSTAMPALLVLLCPPFVLMLWTTLARLDGSVATWGTAEGVRTLLHEVPLPSAAALGMILFFAAFEAALLRGLPARTFLGPVSPAGNRPTYRLNGVAAFLLTHGALLGAWALGWSPARIYDRFGELLATLCVVALGICALLYLRGRRMPRTADTGTTGNALFDFYWGTELHPRLFGMELKQLCNCRLSMMGWGVLLVAFMAKQYELEGRVTNTLWLSAGLQLAYIFKFFVWESGYFTSIDIAHDRFGFYICWGVLCWLPALYPIGATYLVTHPGDLPWPLALLVGGAGIASLFVNYAADRQRQHVRAAEGKTTVWGRPPHLIEARYVAEDGSEHTNLLLASGWWAISRHFHYLPELFLAYLWTMPAGFQHVLPYAYPVFLTILLLDRVGRTDLRCQRKYGPAWDSYRERVRYKLIPGLY